MGYPKDGRRGLAALTYHNTIPDDEIDPPAVRWGEDPPPASAWQRYLAESGRGRDSTAARAAVLPAADPGKLRSRE